MGIVRQLPKAATGIPEVDRFLQLWADALNPLFRTLPVSADFIAGESDASQTATALTVAAGGNIWTDIPGTAQTFTPKSAARRIKAHLLFTAFATGAAGNSQVRLILNGAQQSSVRIIAWATMSQHMSWDFIWPLPPGALGAIGTVANMKAQVISPTGSTAAFNMDANDSSALIMEELG